MSGIASLATIAGQDFPFQTVDGAIFVNSNAFFAATITTAITIGGALFGDADSFFAATVTQDVRALLEDGSYELLEDGAPALLEG